MRRNMSPVRKPKDTKKTILRILKYMSKYKLHIVFVLIGIIFSSIATIAGNYLLKPIINNLTTNSDIKEILKPISMMVVFYSLGVIGNYLYARLMLKISTGTLLKIRTDLFKNMEKLPIKHFDTHTHGELMSRFTSDIDTLREMLSNGIPNLFSSSITIVGVFFAMLFLSPILTSLIILMLFVMLFVIKTIGKKSAIYFKEQQKNNGILNGYVEEMTEGIKVVKIFNRENEVIDKFETLNENLCKSATNANICANILMPIMGNLSYMNYAITAGVGGFLVINKMLDIGTIASFLQYTRSFSQPITQISQQFNSILNALAGAERIFEMIDTEKEVDEGNVTLVYAKETNGILEESKTHTGTWAWKVPTQDSFKLVKLLGDVRFNNVTFGYNDDKIVLKNVSLYAKPGQKIAFVGSTGAGKTTITNLLNRFYDIKDGEITYDGIDIKQIKKDALRASLSMVLQDTHLFTGTVRDNIRYGKLDATDEEVENAARLANAHSFIMHLPDGYDTLLTADGSNLSQGQRQLIAIARAAVANPPVLILDEATSSIDTRTEKLIEKGMNTLMKGRTVFVIAHRLSTVRNSDAIMVLENGEIIERGDHDELLKQQGKYYKLYTGMFELS
ncbi:MAG: ABC transporter ATP-binding protein [Ruminococcaceae bacterium]|nr:ABC transporter ATP-binding protein [Oscillospiraceae bacterium]